MSQCQPHDFIEHSKSGHIFCKKCGTFGSWPNHDGMIMMWNGAADQVPVGWSLCDGSNGTPDLRDKFVLGSSKTHPTGSKGGRTSTDATLDESNMPAHKHARHCLTGKEAKGRDIPIMQKEMDVDESNAFVLSKTTVNQKDEAKCKTCNGQRCRGPMGNQWATTRTAEWRATNGHEDEPVKVFVADSWADTTGTSGHAQPSPLKIPLPPPPFLALAFIMCTTNLRRNV